MDSEYAFQAVDRQLGFFRTELLHVTSHAQLTDVADVQLASPLVQCLEQLEIPPLRYSGNLIAVLKPNPFVQTLVALRGVAGLTDPNRIIRHVRSTMRTWKDVLQRQRRLISAVSTLVQVLPYVLANG